MIPPSRSWVLGEFAGTFLLVFTGCGVVATAVLTGAQVGIFQVAIVWGLGIAGAIYLTAALSGAHLNPAVTLALVACRKFPPARAAGYVLTQFLGALVAAGLLHLLFAGVLAGYEARHGIVRGAAGSEASAMIFGEFFPNPGGQPLTVAARATVSSGQAFLVELTGTALLVLVILGVTDDRNGARPRELVAPVIGLTVTVLISLFGPLTMAGFNPARDLAPRVFSALAGWGTVPFAANGWGWLTVYVLAPCVGGLAGSLIYVGFFRPAYAAAKQP